MITMKNARLIIGANEAVRGASKKRASSSNYIVGVDEVGRGSLAGRIFVGAVLLSVLQNNELRKCMRLSNSSLFRHILHPRRTSLWLVESKFSIPCRLTDSKKLSEKQRNEWFLWVKKNKIPFTISAVSSSVIDRINIARACDKAANRAVLKLMKKNRLKHIGIVADAGISIGQNGAAVSFRSFPKADETVPAVSLASIVAKVSRDSEMVKMGKVHKHYGFEEHKGYGTKKHVAAIKKHGPSSIHRLTFIKKFTKIRW